MSTYKRRRPKGFSLKGYCPTSGKAMYEDRATAERASSKIGGRMYRCDRCKCYHVTTLT